MKNKTIFAYIFLVICSFFTVFPLIFLISISFRNTKDIMMNGYFSLPDTLYFSNYIEAFEKAKISTYYMNSIIISAISIVGVLFFVLLISYSMVYHNFRGKEFINNIILLGLIIPFEIVIIPLFYNMKFLNLLGTLAPVYITHIALNIPFCTFLIRGFIKDIPEAIIESSRIDGAGEFRILYSIVRPVITPALVSIIVLIFMWTWNDFMLSNIMLRDDAMRTLPLGLVAFKGKFGIDIPLTAAASTIMMTPILLVYMVFQKQMIAGLSVGSVKG